MGIFKECDIRGIYNEELNDVTAYDIGMAAGKIIDGKLVLVCGDVRKSTPALKENLINGLIDSGAQVIDMGLAPTPVFYFGKNYLNSYAGIMVTASHNPPQYNGFKVMFGDMPVTADDIKGIEKTIQSKAYISGKGSVTENDKIIPAYIDMLNELVGRGNLKVVIDCGDGTTSKIAPIVFQQHGYEVEELYCDWDGDFPNRDPNPAVYSNLLDLTEKVKKTKADIGIAFDGDGDRVVFVDENGEILPSEQSLVILLRKYLENEKSSLVYDLKSSSIVASETRKIGSVPIMERSGHAFIKRTFKNNNSILAGEISGHFFFRELGQDDGIYAALKMCEIISNSGLTLSQLKSDIPKTSITPDIRIPIAYKKQDDIIEVLRQFSDKYTINEIDGIRIDFGYGWALVRKSVTEQAITLRVEAQTKEQISDIIHKLIEKSPEFEVEQIKEYL